jgi:hypothetical protein
MRMRSISLALALFALSSLAAPLPALRQLAVSDRMVCGIGTWGGLAGQYDLRCWDLAIGAAPGAPLPRLPIDGATQVAVSADTVCAVASGKIHCWQYAVQNGAIQIVAKDYFKAVTQAQLLTPGRDGTFCAYDGRYGVVCSLLVTMGGPFIRPYALALGSDQQICALMSGGPRDVQCIVAIDAPAQCQQNMDKMYFPGSGFTEIAVAHGPHPDCLGCVAREGYVDCWGDGTVPPPEGNPGSAGIAHPSHLAFLSVPEISTRDRVPCAMDGTVIKCRKDRKFVPLAAYQDFPSPLWFDGVEGTHCAINRTQMRCFAGAKTVPIWHGLSIDFELSTLEAVLAEIAQRVYHADADLFHSLADSLPQVIADQKLTGADETQLRFFLLSAIEPVMSAIPSDYFAQAVLPNYQAALSRYRAQFPEASLDQFPPSTALRYGALSFLKGCLPILKSAITDSAAQNRFGAFTTQLGVALATGGTTSALRDLAASYATVAADIEALDGSAAGSASRLTRALMGYLTH